jgi:biotin operon repressor
VSEGAFDEVIHEKNRLRICGILAGTDSVSFPALAEALGVSDSVLSKHIRTLQETGHVSVVKARSAGPAALADRAHPARAQGLPRARPRAERHHRAHRGPRLRARR